jgi:HAD superfamily hydrolase (TIGR01509 family)
MDISIIIPLCGRGQRFVDEGYSIPKPCIPVFEKTILQYALDSFKGCKIYIFTNIEEVYQQQIVAANPTVSVISIGRQTIGAADTVYAGLQIAGIRGKCLIADGDAFYTEDIINILGDTNAVISFRTEKEHPVYSYVETDETMKILKIREKEKISNLANTGAYFFKDADELKMYCKYVLDNKIYYKGEPYISCVIQCMLEKYEVFVCIEIPKDRFICLGTPTHVREYIKRTRAWLFDLDGTLVKTDDVYFSVWKDILKVYGLHITPELYNTYIYSNSDDIVIKTLLQNTECDVSKISEMKNDMFQQRISNIKIIDGASEFILSRKSLGDKVAVVTNCNRPTAESILKEMGVYSNLDIIVVGSECIRPKPHPDPYEEAIRFFNIPAGQCVVLEDSKNGILSGKSVCPQCIIGIGNTDVHDMLRTYGATYTFVDFKNIDVNTICSSPPLINLNEYLQCIFPGENVIISPIKLKGGFISDVLAVNVNDCRMVLKVENSNVTPLSQMANNLDLYESEYLFYQSFSSLVPVNVPHFYGKVYDQDYRCIGILLEDLRKDNYILNIDLNTAPVEASLSVVDSIACLHAKFWNKNLVSKFNGLRRNNTRRFNWVQFITDRADIFKDKWRLALSKNDIDIVDTIVSRFADIQNELSEGYLTLCHGDVKSPNIFYSIENEVYKPYFLDWQYIVEGKGVQDLVFFMIESFSVETLPLYFPLLKNYYYMKLRECGVKNYSYDEYTRDLRSASHYFPFFVAIWFGTTSEDDLIDKNFPYFFIQKLFSFYKLVGI